MSRFRIVTWNIERGIKLDKIADILRNDIHADIYALQEVDIHARRSACRDVAYELSNALGLACKFGKEFREIAQEGCGTRTAFHGQAFLSRAPTLRSELFYFPHQLRDWSPRWYHRPLVASGVLRLQTKLIKNVASIELGHAVAHVFQPREGGRMALFGEFELGGRKIFVYNTHLESHATDEQRALQMQDILDDAETRLARDDAIIILGDLNNDLEADSPVIKIAQKYGFVDALLDFKDRDAPTSRDGKKIDWILAKNIRITNGYVYANGLMASDHSPVVAEFKFI